MESVQANDGFDVAAHFAAIDVHVRAFDEPAGDSPRVNFEGTILKQLDPSGPAALAGLRAQDQLLLVNGSTVADVSDIRTAWSQPVEGRLVLVFKRDGQEQTLDVPVPSVRRFLLPSSVLTALAR